MTTATTFQDSFKNSKIVSETTPTLTPAINTHIQVELQIFNRLI